MRLGQAKLSLSAKKPSLRSRSADKKRKPYGFLFLCPKNPDGELPLGRSPFLIDGELKNGIYNPQS